MLEARYSRDRAAAKITDDLDALLGFYDYDPLTHRPPCPPLLGRRTRRLAQVSRPRARTLRVRRRLLCLGHPVRVTKGGAPCRRRHTASGEQLRSCPLTRHKDYVTRRVRQSSVI